MNSASPMPAKARPKYYDLNVANLPVAGFMSILHRVSGMVMFLFLIPLLLIILQQTLQSEAGYDKWKTVFAHPLAKLALLGFTWAYLHHFFAGIRYLLLDVHIGIQKVPAQQSAKLVLVLAIVGTVIVGWLVW